MQVILPCFLVSRSPNKVPVTFDAQTVIQLRLYILICIFNILENNSIPRGCNNNLDQIEETGTAVQDGAASIQTYGKGKGDRLES